MLLPAGRQTKKRKKKQLKKKRVDKILGKEQEPKPRSKVSLSTADCCWMFSDMFLWAQMVLFDKLTADRELTDLLKCCRCN